MEGSYSPIFAALKARRLGLKLSQEAVAREAGLTQAYYSKIEHGKVAPRLHTLEDISRALQLEFMLVPVEYASTVRSIVEAAPASAGKPLFAVRPD